MLKNDGQIVSEKTKYTKSLNPKSWGIIMYMNDDNKGNKLTVFQCGLPLRYLNTEKTAIVLDLYTP